MAAASATTRSGAPTRAVGRRRADRSGRPPDRSRALVPRRLRRRRRRRGTYFWEMPVDDNAFLMLRTAPGRPRSCTSAAPSGRTCSRSRSTAATARSRSTASAEATASSGSRSTGCCPRWARPRRRFGSIRAAIDLGARVRGVSRRHPRRPRAVGRPWPTRAPRSSRRRSRFTRQSGYDACRPRSMIITRSPLRITLGGGGTDLPSYYREHGWLSHRRRDRQVRLRDGDAARSRRASS